MKEQKERYTNNVFEESWWLDIVAQGNWEEIVSRDKNGNIQARIAYVHNNKKVYMPPFTQTLGIWMCEDLKKDYGTQKKIICELFECINRYKKVCIHLAPENEYVLPFRWMGYDIFPRFTYRISGLEDSDKLYEGFNKTAKKNIKSARNKVYINYETDVDVLLMLLDKTFEAQNRTNPMSKKIIHSIVETCEKNGHGKYIDARDRDGNVHSVAYFVCDEKVWYYLFGASDPQYRSSGAQSLVLWEAMQMAGRQTSIFDFEGSMIEGIENFFRQFGGQCVPYFEVRKNGLLGDIMVSIKPRLKRLLRYKI